VVRLARSSHWLCRIKKIRLQICAAHTKYDVDYVLEVLREYKGIH